MPVPRVLHALFVIVPLAGLGPAAAGEPTCTTLLQNRVLDLRDTRALEERVQHVRDVLCLPAYKDISDLRRVNQWSGDQLTGALAAFGFRGDGLTWELTRQQLCGPRGKPIETLRPRFVELRAADRGLMQAFRECVKTSRQVEAWVEIGPYWILSVLNRQPEQPRSPRFRTLATAPEKDLCTIERGFVTGQVFRDDQAFCRYHPNKPTSVTITGDSTFGQLTIKVPQ